MVICVDACLGEQMWFESWNGLAEKSRQLLENQRANLQTDVGVFHTFFRQAGDAEALAVLLKTELICGSWLGSAELSLSWEFSLQLR